jgi:ribosome-binding factor A
MKRKPTKTNKAITIKVDEETYKKFKTTENAPSIIRSVIIEALGLKKCPTCGK